MTTAMLLPPGYIFPETNPDLSCTFGEYQGFRNATVFRLAVLADRRVKEGMSISERRLREMRRQQRAQVVATTMEWITNNKQ